MATSSQNPGRLILGGTNNRDITIKRLQRQLVELMQIMVNSKLMRLAKTATPRQTGGQNKEPTLPSREGRYKKQNKTHVSVDSQTNIKTVAMSKQRRSAMRSKSGVDLYDAINAK